MQRMLITGLAAAGFLWTLSGCKAPPRPSAWESAYQSVVDAPAASGSAEVVIRRIDAETLRAEPRVTGFELIGKASLRDEQMGVESLGPDGVLTNLARAKGATLVLMSETPAGTEKREKLVRTRTPGGSQDITGGRPSVSYESVPVMVDVEVYDYFALFYRTSGDSSAD
ncbi:MAG: hypothetical protein ACF8SC_01750 [Phycisphaerales bacterium JB037]